MLLCVFSKVIKPSLGYIPYFPEQISLFPYLCPIWIQALTKQRKLLSDCPNTAYLNKFMIILISFVAFVMIHSI